MTDPSPYQPPGGNGDREAPTLTVGLAIGFTISASFLSLVLTVGLASSLGGALPPAVAGVGALLGYGAAFALARPFIEDPPGPSLGFVAAPRRAWAAALLFLPSILVISEMENVLADVWPRPEPDPDAAPPPSGPAWIGQLVLAGVVVQPLVQEIFFRGLLQPRLVPHWGSRGAVLGTALLGVLAAVPFQLGAPSTLVVPLGCGLLQGWLRRAAGSIYPGLLLGMGFGGLGILAHFEAFGIAGFDITGPATHTPVSTLALPAMLLGIGLGLCRHQAPTVREASEENGADSP